MNSQCGCECLAWILDTSRTERNLSSFTRRTYRNAEQLYSLSFSVSISISFFFMILCSLRTQTLNHFGIDRYCRCITSLWQKSIAYSSALRFSYFLFVFWCVEMQLSNLSTYFLSFRVFPSIGIAAALVMVIPPGMRVTGIAYLFLWNTFVGGNCVLLAPVIQDAVQEPFDASPSEALRIALLFTYVAGLVFAGLFLFVAAVLQYRRTRRKDTMIRVGP